MITKILVGARQSPLSQVQVTEVLNELRLHHPKIVFEPIFIKTTGDQDLKTSLRTLGKTDFFTKEIDDLLLSKKCRIAIHSGKDLPDPLPQGLALIAVTKGLDPSDSLVLRPSDTVASLKHGAIIATSSERREVAVKALRADFKFIDLRGTIGQRLAKLERFEADGVVVAEAALIRLNLTHLNRIKLAGETVPMQGQLAIVAQKNDLEMSQLFKCLDSRKKGT